MMRSSGRNRLSLRVPFRKDEPAYALLGRLALRHGHVSLHSFAACVDLARRPLYGSEMLSEVAKLAGIDPTKLTRCSPISCSRHKFQYQNAVFGRSKWTPERRRSCPLCIREDLSDPHAIDQPWMCHRRFWWDFWAVDSCPIHRTWLIDTCPKCKTTFEPDYTNVRMCRCRYDLAAYTPDILSESDCKIDAYILARLLGSPHSGLGPLENMPLPSAVLAISGVGSAEVLRKGELFETVNRERRLECKMAAGELLQNWPQGFDKGLDRRVAEWMARQSSDVSDGAGHIYGSLYRWLCTHRDSAYDVLRSGTAQHYFSQVAPHRVTKIFGKRACPLMWTSVSAVNNEFGLPSLSRELYPLLCALEIAEPGNIRHADLRIPRTRMVELRNLWEDSLQIGEASRKLGVQPRAIRHFIDLGLIGSIYHYHTHLISKNDVTRLLSATIGIQTRTFDGVPVGAISLAMAGRQFKTVALARIVQAIVKGTVSIVGRLSGQLGFQSLLVDVAAVRNLVPPKERSETLSRRNATRLLKLDRPTIQALIKLGYLRTSTSEKGGPAKLTFAGIRAFKSEYIVAGQAAKRVGMCGKSLVAALRAAGIVEQVSGSMIRRRFYRRTKRLHAALESLRQHQFKSRTEAVLSITRDALLEHGGPLQARYLTSRITEQGVSMAAGRAITIVSSILWRHSEEFVRIPGRGYWFARVSSERARCRNGPCSERAVGVTVP
jgi:hypothetical protein